MTKSAAGCLAASKLEARVRALAAEGKGDRVIARECGISRHKARRLLGIEGAAMPEKSTARLAVPVGAIIIGNRTRQDFGDIASLARSIDANGLLHPVVVRRASDAGYELIAGERRLKAWQLSKFRDDPIPVTIVDLASVMRGEWAENHERKNFTPSETVSIKRALEIEFDLKGEAEKRQKAGTKAAPGEAGEANEIVAAYTGKSRATIEKAEKVVAAAERDPLRFGKLRDDMDRTGKVDGPAKRLAIMEQADAIRSAPPTLPGRGPYSVMVIDFPWPHEPDMSQEEIDAAGRSLRPYAAMAIKTGFEFLQDKIGPLLADDCVVFFWTTNFHMRDAFALLPSFGFPVHSTIGTYIKQRMGRGQVLRDKTEHCIIARRGKPLINLTSQTTDWSGWKQPRENSRKPDEFYRMVEELCPAPRYADIFSFGGRGEKWDCFGDQAQRMAPMAEAAE
jgi:N6-adenosine-specific RNA methylase IME4